MQEQTNSLPYVLLERYAQASHDMVLTRLDDLDQGDAVLPAMLPWCREQGGIVVLKSGQILTSSPGHRKVQNCRVLMINQQVTLQRVRAATDELIQALLVDAESRDAVVVAPVTAASAEQARLTYLLRDAIEAKATHIHLTVRESSARIHLRCYGELSLHAEWLPQLGREVAASVLADPDGSAVTEPDLPADVLRVCSLDHMLVRYRATAVSVHGGVDVVIHLLATGQEKIQSLQALGYQAKQARMLGDAVQLPAGAVVVAGPVRAGKTAAIAACVEWVDPSRKVYTVERPIERYISTASQVLSSPHPEGANEVRHACMRDVLAMDPDVVVMGNVDTRCQANMMSRTALAGHLVFASLHARSALAIPQRLIDMGLSRSVVCDADFLACLVSQRLLPKLCQHCSQPVLSAGGLDEARVLRWRALFGERLVDARARKPGGCEHCRQSGVAGTTVVAEVIWMDDRARQFIAQDDRMGWEAQLRSQGWRAYPEQAQQMVMNGLVDPADVERVIGVLRPKGQPAAYQYD